MKKLLLLSALLIFACTDDEGNPCVYEPTLTTEAVTDITETSATLNGTIDVYSQNCDTVENILQGFVYSTSSEPTIDDDIINVDGTSITESLTNLEPDTTYYVRVFLVRPLTGIFYGNEVSFVTEESIDPIDCDVVYLDDNGVTIKAYPCANIGDVGTINGVQYTVVDREMLFQMRGDFGQIITTDFTRLCTTRVTDMNNLFLCYEEFNQPIGNWDVVNVTDMSYMFYSECSASLFDQDISLWDVSNVTDMSGMFGGNAGNSNDRTFNQDISQWNVSSVTDMGYIFEGAASFNQPIGNWNVSNVTDMSYMFFYATSFNQPINNWDVVNVTNMSGMFNLAQAYNQSILGWDTSNVTDMSYMFSEAYSFNQDSNNINTVSVTNCTGFCLNATSWTLPKPNFSNCGEIGCN
jgi:surface protein